MKAIINYFILFFLIFSFANINAQSDAKTDKYISIDTEKDISDKLNKFLFAESVLFLDEAKKEFNKIESSADLAKFYNITIPKIYKIIYKGIDVSNPEVEYAGDDAPVKTWAFFSKYMPFIRITLMCSECDAGPHTNTVPLIEIALQTNEKDDDIFFETLEIIFGDSEFGREIIWDGGGNLGNWHTMDGCDFCSYSNLGSGTIFQILSGIQSAKKAGNNFTKRLDELKYRALSHMNSDNYASTKTKVLDEIKKILNEIELTDDEITGINDNKKRIETSSKIQFNCQAGGCKYDF